MKKLLLLSLLLMGMVSTASAKTIYLKNNWGKSNIWIGIGTVENDSELSWSKLVRIGYVGDNEIFLVDLGESTKYHITYANSGDGNKGTGFLNSSDLVNDKCYQFAWDNATILEATSDALTLYSHNFTVTTADDYTALKLYTFKDSKGIYSNWGGSPEMTKSGNVYTYSINSIYDNIGVVFFNNNGQTGDLWANSGDNSYYIANMATAKQNDSWGEGVKTNAYGYATYVNYHPLSIPTGIAFYATDNSNGSATAVSLTAPAANTAMIIKGESNTIYNFAAAELGTDYSSTNAFHAGDDANLGANDGGGYNYILKGDALYLANDNYVASNKAYLKLSQAATAKALIFMEDEETDGIKAVQNSVIKGNGEVYNLAGQRVAKDYKGIVIKNGKKYMNK